MTAFSVGGQLAGDRTHKYIHTHHMAQLYQINRKAQFLKLKLELTSAGIYLKCILQHAVQNF